MLSILKNRFPAVPGPAWVLALTLLCLVPFLGKAFHIDDTLFLRAAEQIQKRPADFYGFQMNWFGTTQPMIVDFDNPPLTSYYIALVASIGGWSEPVIHAAFILPALALAWGIFSLARVHCTRPALAAVTGVLTPVFIISATTVMCDILLAALWVWAIVLFERGLEANGIRAFLGSGLLIGLAYWTKFTAMALIPLLLAYGLCRKRRAGWWLLALLLPILFVVAYEWVSYRLYGKGALLSAAVYSSAHGRGAVLDNGMLGLTFLGGCFLPLFFYSPWLWSRRALVKGLCVLGPCALVLLLISGYQRFIWRGDGPFGWARFLECALFVLAGLHILALGAMDFWERRDAPSLLLSLWILGILMFAIAFNWTVNGRSLLPMLPAVGILLARRVDQLAHESRDKLMHRIAWLAIPGAVVSLLVAKADFDSANHRRSAAESICKRYQRQNKTIWFEGHWGFQYYMEQGGAKALDRWYSVPDSQDIVVVPSEGADRFDFANDLVQLVEIVEYSPSTLCSSMNLSAGAGFYASAIGPLPFVFGTPGPERYYIFQVTRNWASAFKTPGAVSSQGAMANQFRIEREVAAGHLAVQGNVVRSSLN